MEHTESILDLTNKYLTYRRRGCLSVAGEPTYIVELVKEYDTALYACVYECHPHPKGTKGLRPRKKAVEVEVKKNVFSNNTVLGQIANKLIPTKVEKKWVESEPIFISPIVVGVSTLTGKKEEGFYERTPDVQRNIGGKLKWVEGEYSGVFVGLSSIVWYNDYSVTTDSIVKALIKEQQEKSNFYDLEINNNDPNNPLSRYYVDKRGSEV
ncbi:hypothetical protein vBBceHLY2_00065 [Bacillus phage vB_BceH_LY2]|nr:hypothetical protein vBBceHLY2_00065 [Bacillus phage vB_BceH_LY2]